MSPITRARPRGCRKRSPAASASLSCTLPDVHLRRILCSVSALTFRISPSSSDDGTAISTSSFLGTPLVLYFYPKDDTPGCTSEAGQFTALYESFRAKGVRIVGVSRDTAAAHQKFKAKYDIPYPLLADVESKLCDACGVIVEKTMYGKKSMGLQRSTFLFDAAGTVAYAWKKVSVEGHAAAVFAKLPETVCRAG